MTVAPPFRGRYRATGADAPWHDPRHGHGVPMEGYFWRFTDATAGRVVAVLCGVCEAADGTWAVVGVGTHPGHEAATQVVKWARADAHGPGVSAGPGVLEAEEISREPNRPGMGGRIRFSRDSGGAERLRVALGDGTRVDVRIEDPVPWPLRLSGVGLGQVVPGLGQYWHPALLGGRTVGEAYVHGETIPLDGAQVYAEKNWGTGFPQRWWWGQAHGFERADACVAFAGGPVTVGPVRTTATALVVRLGDDVLRLGDPLRSPVRADVGGGLWRLRGRSARHTVELEGSGALAEAHALPVPFPAERRAEPGALEHLGAHVRVTVRRGRRLVWSGESTLAGLEEGGLALTAGELARRADAAAADEPGAHGV